MTEIDGRAPCIVGVARRTWHPDEVGDAGAPEPLLMWHEVAAAAMSDARAGGGIVDRLGSLQVVYCQTTQYDDPVGRLADLLGADPLHRHYSGIGGTTPQVLVNQTAERILRGELDIALVCGAEALATKRRFKQRGERPAYSFPPAEKPDFPWEAPFHPAEVAHQVFQAWLTFAVFENARRAHLGVPLDAYRWRLGELWAPFTEVAALNPHAWFRTARSVDEIVVPTDANRMVGYPYTKYMVSIMDVDMAAALVLTSHDTAESLGIPPERRVYLRGWCDATDPTYVAEHAQLWRSPAMEAAAREALRVAGAGVDDVAHLDLYSCFASSVEFACDAIGIAPDDPRELTVTGGLPYHGGAGSDYLTHSIATMVETLRGDPGALGVVSGVGMHMTKHVYGVYSTEPGPVAPPHDALVQRRVEQDAPARPIVDAHEGDAVVAAYSVVHGRDGAPDWGLLVCDVPGGDARCYARVDDAELLAAAEDTELVGETVHLTPADIDGPTGPTRVNRATSPS